MNAEIYAEMDRLRHECDRKAARIAELAQELASQPKSLKAALKEIVRLRSENNALREGSLKMVDNQMRQAFEIGQGILNSKIVSLRSENKALRECIKAVIAYFRVKNLGQIAEKVLIKCEDCLASLGKDADVGGEGVGRTCSTCGTKCGYAGELGSSACDKWQSIKKEKKL